MKLKTPDIKAPTNSLWAVWDWLEQLNAPPSNRLVEENAELREMQITEANRLAKALRG